MREAPVGANQQDFQPAPAGSAGREPDCGADRPASGSSPVDDDHTAQRRRRRPKSGSPPVASSAREPGSGTTPSLMNW